MGFFSKQHKLKKTEALVEFIHSDLETWRFVSLVGKYH